MVRAVIIINGFPGVGKSSVARELATLLPRASVLEAHLLDVAAESAHNPVTCGRANAELKKRLRDTIVRALPPPALLLSHAPAAAPRAPGRIVIITDTLYTSSPTSAFLQSYLGNCRSSGLNLIHVVLSCDSGSNISRIGSAEVLGGTGPGSVSMSMSMSGGHKVDEDTLVALRMEEEVAHFMSEGEKIRGGTVDGLLGEMDLDTSEMGVGQAAGMVARYCDDLLRKQAWYTPLAK